MNFSNLLEKLVGYLRKRKLSKPRFSLFIKRSDFLNSTTYAVLFENFPWRNKKASLSAEIFFVGSKLIISCEAFDTRPNPVKPTTKGTNWLGNPSFLILFPIFAITDFTSDKLSYVHVCFKSSIC